MAVIKEMSKEKLLFLIVLLIIAAAIMIFTSQEKEPALSVNEETEFAAALPVESSAIEALEKSLEEKIASNLESIKGVGKTKVLVTYTSGLYKEYARDQSTTKRTSQETDREGGVRKTEEVTESNKLVLAGNSNPVVVVEQRPEIAGVLVIAQGANDPKIKEQIFEAVKTLLNISPSKISVAPLGGV
ncbi:MAG TPA: stage III sporulation protein AG [Peptococcaceae bacterium]|nr:stage III sporulation protein AG [Peptococcaceae bacterium]